MRQVKQKYSGLSIFLHSKKKLERLSITNELGMSPDEDLVIKLMKTTGEQITNNPQTIS